MILVVGRCRSQPHYCEYILTDDRSTGAYSLLIWTHNLNHIEYRPIWHIPGTQNSTDVLICGSGNNWGRAYTAAHKHSRTVVGGEDATVGLGGLIQNGGHGLLSSHYGLASDHVLQVTIVTTVVVAEASTGL